MDDYKVRPRSAKAIEEITLAWRDTLGVPNDWAPDIVRLLESKLPNLISTFGLIVRTDAEMGEAEAYTEFNPPHIAVRESVYHLARKGDGRSRMTFAHELGHLVMHPGATKLRGEARLENGPKIKPYESAEWQANKFASLFLMPRHIAMQFTSPSQLAECCQTSAQAAAIRFGELDQKSKPLPICVREIIERELE
jgi:Zn-dependent peptidase ImmA (M78 family)